MNFNKNESMWYQRYLPTSLDDVVLPEQVKNNLRAYVKAGNMPHLGFWSANPGVGKSSTANALLKELNCEALFLNASLEKGIDVLRSKIQDFASQSSFDDKRKVVVMDEFDNFSRDGQAAFRGFLDKYGQNCAFIFTGNYKEKIIEPLINRLENYDFGSFDKKEMIKPIFARLCAILDNENIKYEKTDLVPIMNTYYPSVRQMIGALQRFSSTGNLVIDTQSLDNVSAFDEIMNLCTPSTYYEMVSKVNSMNAPDGVYTYLYHNADKYFEPSKFPNVVIVLAKYQNMNATARDKNLNTCACLTELIQFRKK
jgi:DNA polymerase III delta prime subunit